MQCLPRCCFSGPLGEINIAICVSFHVSCFDSVLSMINFMQLSSRLYALLPMSFTQAFAQAFKPNFLRSVLPFLVLCASWYCM